MNRVILIFWIYDRDFCAVVESVMPNEEVDATVKAWCLKHGYDYHAHFGIEYKVERI